MSGLRVGVIGAGMIGVVHARAARLAGGHLAGVVSSTPDRSIRAARRLGAAAEFHTPEELIGADEIDVVHICTPTRLHAPLAAAALQAGKHVVCEKPLAMDAAEAASLTELAADSGLVAAVPFIYRYYAVAREARSRIRSGASGRVQLIHGHYLQDWLLDADDDNWRVDAALGGASRAFGDIGTHWCDLAQFISGHRIASVSARTHVAHPQRRRGPARPSFSPAAPESGLAQVDTEDAAAVQFRTDQGALGSLVVSQISAGHKNDLTIEFNAGTESLSFRQEQPETLWCGRRGSAELIVRDPVRLSADAARVTSLPAGHPEGYERCFEAFVGDVYQAIRDGNSPEGMPTFTDGLSAARIVDTVLKSARTGQWTDVTETGSPDAQMTVSTAAVRTERPGRYGKQLVAHLSRRGDGQWADETASGWITLGDARAELAAADGVLELLVTGRPEQLPELEDVVGRHLVRFGARDELVVQWTRAGGAVGTEQRNVSS